MMIIRKATLEVIPQMQEIFVVARRFMAATGNPNQWTDSYLSDELLTDDIARGITIFSPYGF